MRLVALRGANTVTENTAEAILAATDTLMREILARNKLGADDLVSCIFTLTPDLDADVPGRRGARDGPVERAAAVRARDPGPGRAAEGHPRADPRLQARRHAPSTSTSARRSSCAWTSPALSSRPSAGSGGSRAARRSPSAAPPSASEARSGCWSVQTSGTVPTGEPKSSRTAKASDVSGLHSAIWRRPSGRPETGTKMPLRNIAGKITPSRSRPRRPGRAPSARPTRRPR